MGTVYEWTGDAIAVAQVDTLTPTAAGGAGRNYDAIMNGKTVRYTSVGADTVATICTGLKNALAASTIPEFYEVTWTENGSLITGTAKTAGKPFTVTTAVSGDTSGTLTQATSTAVNGPNVWSVENFKVASTGARATALPGAAASDEVHVQGPNKPSILYNLDQSLITNAVLLTVAPNFTNYIGLPRQNQDDTTKQYDEYRPTFLKLKTTSVTIGFGVGTGSGRIKIDSGASGCRYKIYGSGSQIDDMPPIQILGSSGTSIVEVLGGHVGIAVDRAQSSTFDEIYATGLGTIVKVGPGVVMGLVNVTKNAKAILDWRAIGLDALYITDAGQVDLYGGVSADGSSARTMTYIYARTAGILNLLCEGGTSANMEIGASATVDARSGPSKMSGAAVVNVFTVTNLAHAQAGNQTDGLTRIYDPGKRIYWQAGLQLDGKMKGFDLDLGTPVKIVSGGGSLS